MVLKNYSLIRLIEQTIKQYKLDLSGYNILLPVYSKEYALAPIMANLAGAKNIYSFSQNLEEVNNASFYENQLNLTSNITFIERETPQILSNLDIILYGGEIPCIDGILISALKKECVISILPSNLDFNQTIGINLEECTRKKISVISVNPADKNLSLYRHLANLVTTRCCERGIDVFRSRLLLVSNGELSNCLLSHLKGCGAQVYAAHTDKTQDSSYILKHLAEVDAVIIADYPIESPCVLGNDGFIRIEDILTINPEIKIVHLSGKVETNSLSRNRIQYWPVNLAQNSLNVNINELGPRVAAEIIAASMKISESLIKERNNNILSNDSIVTYNVVNPETPILLGKNIF